MELHDKMLLVPIKVKALMIGNETEAEFAGPTVNFGAAFKDGAKIQTEPFARHKKPRSGVHLHWFLPECLVHGIKEAEADEISYPFLPDRWVVTRVEVKRSTYYDRHIRCKSFEVESNFISKEKNSYNDGSIRVPTEMGNWYLGRSGEYGRLPAGGCYGGGLTAAGFGEPGFYAYYPNCRNVFGFYDDMEGVADDSQIFYQICGWYNEEERDPVYGLNGEELARKLRQMGFEFSREMPKKGSIFWKPQGEGNALLLHGACYGLVWEGAGKDYQSGVPKENPQIAVGNTSLEAFAALIVNQTKSQDMKSERLLNVFLGDLLEEWADLDGVIQVEEKIHRNTFQPEDGGVRWSFKKREGAGEIGKAEEREFAGRLELLNRQEERLEKGKDFLRYYKKELYFAWYRYRGNHSQDHKQSAAKQWSEKLSAIVKLQRAVDIAAREVRDCAERLLGDAAVYYEMQQVPAERYWSPGEPVILFSGAGMEQDYVTTGNMGEQERLLTIRTLPQLVTSLLVPGGAPNQKVEAEYLFSYVSMSAELPAPIRLLLEEAVLLSPECAAVTAWEALLIRGQEVGEEDYSRMTEVVQEELSRIRGTEGIAFYQAPWEPLYMEWGIEYTPDTGINLENWELEDNDYSLTERLPLAASCKYRGRMVLTPHLLNSLYDTIERYQDKRREEKGTECQDEEMEFLNRLKEELGRFEVLSQRLSGFYTNFLTQREIIQGDLKEAWLQDEIISRCKDAVFARTGIDEVKGNQILEEIVEEAGTEPYIGAIFSPLRAGSAQIKELRIIDSFGQVKEVIREGEYERKADLCISEQMDNRLYKQTMVLPPRLVQPARLTFRWVKEKGACIFGWLVPNYIDGSLMVYDGTGEMIGTYLEITDRGGISRVKFLPARGRSSGADRSGIHPRLREFLESFDEVMMGRKPKERSAFHQFTGFLSDELSAMSLPGMAFQKNLMHFIGRPLALADAEIGIETKTPLWREQTWTGKSRNTNILKTLKLPLRLGDQRKQSEGLVGFFKKEGKGNHYCQNFYAYGSHEGTGYVRFDNRIAVPVNQTVRHTLLFDPAHAVHLVSGVLPVRQERMDETDVLNAQESLNMEMLVNPVFAGADKLRLPLALLPGRTWAFLSGTGETLEPSGSGTFAFEEEYPLKLIEGWIKLEKEERGNESDE